MSVGRLFLAGLVALLVLGAAPGATMTQDCDAECLKDLREKVLRDLRALNDGERMA